MKLHTLVDTNVSIDCIACNIISECFLQNRCGIDYFLVHSRVIHVFVKKMVNVVQ